MKATSIKKFGSLERNTAKTTKLLKNEIDNFRLNPAIEKSTDVKVAYLPSWEEYDEELTKNVVFLDLYDVSASNKIVECIVWASPLVVNKLDAVIEYLGEDYPLYYEKLQDVPSQACEEVREAHDYLKSLDRSQYDIIC